MKIMSCSWSSDICNKSNINTWILLPTCLDWNKWLSCGTLNLIKVITDLTNQPRTGLLGGSNAGLDRVLIYSELLVENRS